MRTLVFSMCLVSLIPFSTFAESNKSDNSSDAIGILKHDHEEIKKLVGEYEKSVESNIEQSRSTIKELKTRLENHEAMEEKDWYPELEKHNELKDIIKKLKEEEKSASDQLEALDSISDEKEWKSKSKKLIKDVKHHAKEEETKLFPKVKKLVDEPTLQKIGEKMKEDYKK